MPIHVFIILSLKNMDSGHILSFLLPLNQEEQLSKPAQEKCGYVNRPPRHDHRCLPWTLQKTITQQQLINERLIINVLRFSAAVAFAIRQFPNHSWRPIRSFTVYIKNCTSLFLQKESLYHIKPVSRPRGYKKSMLNS